MSWRRPATRSSAGATPAAEGRCRRWPAVIQPLFDTRGLLDVLVEWGAAVGDPRRWRPSPRPWRRPRRAPAPATAAPVPRAAYHYLRLRPCPPLAVPPATPAFEGREQRAARRMPQAAGCGPGCRREGEDRQAGGHPGGSARRGSQGTGHSGPPDDCAGRARAAGRRRGQGGRPQALALPHLALGDGRAGNNGWLHELPDPITRITWGGALSIVPPRFDDMKVKRRPRQRRPGRRGYVGA